MNKRKQNTSLIPGMERSTSEIRLLRKASRNPEEGNMPYIPFGDNEYYQIPPEEDMMLTGDSAFGSFMKRRSMKRNESLLSGSFGGPKL